VSRPQRELPSGCFAYSQATGWMTYLFSSEVCSFGQAPGAFKCSFRRERDGYTSWTDDDNSAVVGNNRHGFGEVVCLSHCSVFSLREHASSRWST
jgi:hypothetical protein